MQCVAWIQWYDNFLRDGLVEKEEEIQTIQKELELYIHTFMDPYMTKLQERSSKWWTNIHINERRSARLRPEYDDEHYPVTDGPQDLFLKVNQVVDLSCDEYDLEGLPVLSIANMAAQMVEFFLKLQTKWVKGQLALH